MPIEEDGDASRDNRLRIAVNYARSKALQRKNLEARVRIELTHKGFADLSLTTWVPRPCFLR
jgi:hypothetical protein